MDAIEEVKSRLNIEDVIGEYVQLKRAGRNFKGLSPFTAERTPSFVVSPEKGIWHDFSSGKGGNVFSFVMEVEGLDFRGALELLARKANVDLTQYQNSAQAQTGKRKERLYAALEQAATFYQVQFKHSNDALEYIAKKRRFTKDTVLAFRIGYAPNTGQALRTYLTKQGFQQRDIDDAGLSGRSYRGQTQDMFRGRIMIPLMDIQGRVIGFTARILEDDPSAPKYINTPQTLLYDKSRHVFGLHLAKDAIRTSGFAVLVEGNLDVIASYQAGVQNVIATAGTALTEPHLKQLVRFTADVRIAFDQDKAGIAATERAIPIASKAGVALSIITIPSGKDPDELVRKDPTQWQTIITKPQEAVAWLIDQQAAKHDLSLQKDRDAFLRAVKPTVAAVDNKGEQERTIARIANLLGYDPAAAAYELRKEHRPEQAHKQPKIAPKKVDYTTTDQHKTQDHLLSICLHRMSFRPILGRIPAYVFPSQEGQQLHAFLVQHPDFDGNAHTGAALRDIAEYVKILGLQYDELYSGNEDVDLESETTYLRAELIKQHVKQQKALLTEQLHDADEATTTQVLTTVRNLDELLRTI